MKAVILAAGRGTRLAPLTDDRPKPLVEVGGRPLLLRTLERVIQAGIAPRDVVIVTGYRENMVAELMRREGLACKLVTNPRWFDWNSFYSLAVAKEALAGAPFLQFEGDVLFDQQILPRLLEATFPAVLAVEVKPMPDAEAMKARVIGDDRKLIALSKEEDPARSIGEYVGIARISADVAKLVFDDLDRFVDEGITHQYYDHSYHRLAAAGTAAFHAVDVADCQAIEIDDPTDLARAEVLLRAQGAL